MLSQAGRRHRQCGTCAWSLRPTPYMLADAAAHSLVVTIEDGIRIGGAGTFLVDAMQRPSRARPTRFRPVRMLGLPLEYIPQGRPDSILARLGLDAAGVAGSVMAAARHRAGATSPGLGGLRQVFALVVRVL